jgi:hypothetical protein
MPCHYIDKGKSHNQHPLVAAVAVFCKSPPNPDMVDAPLETDVLKLHEELRNAENLQAI